MTLRSELDVDGTRISYLHSGDAGPARASTVPRVLLLHGTFWSRVWQPVLPRLGEVAECVAVDLPGFGRSDGELDPETATVPALADFVGRVAGALGWQDFTVLGHDIGGGIAQHLAVTDDRVTRLGLVNGVVLDSWPVPAVEKFQDPQVRAATTAEDLVGSRRQSMGRAVARELSAEEIDDYVSPWHSPARARSWMAMAAAADPRYTLDLVDGLVARALPTLLVWGKDDEFQKVGYAERFVQQVPGARLERVPGRHIPQEDSPDAVGRLLADFVSDTDLLSG